MVIIKAISIILQKNETITVPKSKIWIFNATSIYSSQLVINREMVAILMGSSDPTYNGTFTLKEDDIISIRYVNYEGPVLISGFEFDEEELD